MIIKENKLKKLIREKRFRMGKGVILELNKIIENNIGQIIEKATRNALVSGRKTIKKEDLV